MASARETPRNKLITLMYLVFIAMLALNVSKEVLDGFGQVFKKVSKSNERVYQGNQLFYEKIETNSIEKKGKWIAQNERAKKIKIASENFHQKIEDLKNLITEKQRLKDPNLENFEEMDNGESLDIVFFDSSGISPEGDEFIDLINRYKAELHQLFSNEFSQYKALIDERFFTGDENGNIINSDGQPQSWLSHNFEGFPLISSLAKFTMLQNDIRLTESDVLNALLGRELEGSSEVNTENYITLLKAERGVYYQGEKFNGSVLLGRKSGAQNPNDVVLSIDGRKLSSKEYTKIPGGVSLDVDAGLPGDHFIEGELVFLNEGVASKIPVNQSYSVIAKPNSAVISADKMNVVYRGVENPMTISIPGISDDKINASAPGLKRLRGSKYTMNPGKGRELTITASGELPDGEKITTKTKFRIKDLPRPTGSVRGETGSIQIPRSNLEISTIGAVLEDFDFDLTLRTTGFKFKVPGQATVNVKGNKLDAKAKNALRRARAGQTIQIFDITVVNPNNPSYRFKKVSPVICELVN